MQHFAIARPRLIPGALVAALVLGHTVGPLLAETPKTLEGFATGIFEALGSRAKRCNSTEQGLEDRHCATVKASGAKFKRQWEGNLESLEEAVEPVTDWFSGRGLVWRYYTVDGRPFVVQFNSKSKTLEVLGSLLPQCDFQIEPGMVEIHEGGEDATLPELVYHQAFFWPFRAHKADQVGQVRLLGTITTTGEVEELCVDTLNPAVVDLELAAAKAVRKWRFEPAMNDDGPTEARTGFAFGLDPADAQKVVLVN